MNKKIEDLQILRGIAIVAVLLYHLSISSALVDSIGKNLSNSLYWGVELFFVLSGFVVTKSLRSNSFDFMHFTTKRLFRLYPAILFLLVFAAAINAVIRNSTYSNFIKNLFSVTPSEFITKAIAILGGYLINSEGNSSYQLGQMWSLSVEFQFYAFSALLIFFLPRRIRGAAYHLTAYVVLAVSFLYRCEVGTNLFDFRNAFLAYLINYKFDFMASGVLLAFVPAEKLEYFFCRVSRNFFMPYAVLLAVTATLMFVRHPLTANTKNYDSLNGFGMLITLAGSVFLVGYGAVGGFSKSGALRMLRKPLISLGDVSYTVYLFHFLAMVLVWILINECIPQAFSNPYYYGIAQLLLTILVLYPISTYVYRNIEIKGMEIGDKIIKQFNFGAHK